MRHLIGFLFCCLSLAAPATAQTAEEIALIRQVFTKLQPLSIRYDREYCGHIGYDAEGVLRATEPFPGEPSSCLPRDPTTVLVTVVASYHTHAAFALDFYNEIPSQQDVDGDAADGQNGYVATPGGRLWFVNGAEMTVRQICPVNCLPADPNFIFSDGGAVAKFYTYDELVYRLSQ